MGDALRGNQRYSVEAYEALAAPSPAALLQPVALPW
jgi:hypothetical protein